nr:flavonol synthase flavanone 3-hydroxylase [Colletotrichum truncatum]KAF6801609.1 flavonol synthase flavanone 3-hydroxylase [Colletotrichum truncatum]
MLFEADEISERRKIPDFKESYEIGREDDDHLPNIWIPESSLPGFRSFFNEFYGVCYELELRLLRGMALGMGLDGGYFQGYHVNKDNQIRLLHYPPVNEQQLLIGKVERLGAHTDFGSMTLLFQDEVGGLEVEDPNKAGFFKPVPYIPGTIVVNIGDFMQRWSNNTIRSTMHRVQAPPLKDNDSGDRVTRARFSIPYFIGADQEKTVDCIPGCFGPDRPKIWHCRQIVKTLPRCGENNEGSAERYPLWGASVASSYRRDRDQGIFLVARGNTMCPEQDDDQANVEAQQEQQETTTAAAGILPAEHWVQAAREAAEDEDNDSALGEENASSTASITSTILEYRKIHGRTFHGEVGNAQYWGSNDEQQNECWDIKYLGHYSEIEDCTREWTFAPESFDYIHIRFLVGSIEDWPALFKQAYKTLKPGGYLESFEVSPAILSDDDTVPETSALGQWGKFFEEGGRKMGRTFRVLDENLQKTSMEEAGFEEITEWNNKAPIGVWPKDPVKREIGEWAQLTLLSDIEGYVLFMANVMSTWSREEIHVYAAQLRREIRSGHTVCFSV